MPIYVYLATRPDAGCDTCRRAFEVIQPMGERLETCPDCDQPVSKQPTTCATHVVQGAASLRNLGLARLERRSDGSYENVSAQEGHQKTGSLESFAKDLAKGPKPIISD